MNDDILHDRENSPETEQHLKDNADKFNRQNKRVLSLLYSGEKYTAKKVNDTLNIADGGRRLREIFASRKDVKRDWAYDEKGKTSVKEYWLDIPQPPTKADLQKWFTEWQSEQPEKILSQSKLFEL